MIPDRERSAEMSDKSGVFSGGDDTMEAFARKYKRWSPPEDGMTTMEPGGGFYGNQLPTGELDNTPSYYQQYPSHTYSADRGALGSGANLFATYNQQPSRDAQMVGQDAFGLGANPLAGQNQQQYFSDAQVSEHGQRAAALGAGYGVQMADSYAMAPVAGPFTSQAQQQRFANAQAGEHDQFAMTSGADRGAQMDNSYTMGQIANPSPCYSSPSTNAQMNHQHPVASRANLAATFGQQPSTQMQMDSQYAIDSGTNASSSYNKPSSTGYSDDQSTVVPSIEIKHEHDDDDDYDPADPVDDDDDYVDVDDDTKQAGKKRKINKDGRMRKIREPRKCLRHWDKNEVSRALLGIVWACGEIGIHLPFAQAAQLVDQTCTASALQQAILKIHKKFNDEGAQLPRIKMNWPKKGAPPGEEIVVRENAKLPRKKATMNQSTQCNITILRTFPRNGVPRNKGFLPGQNNIAEVQAQHAQLPHRLAMPQAPTSTAQIASSSTGMNTSPTHSTASESAGIKLEAVQERISSPNQASGSPPSTPVQHHHSPVCPPAPHHSMAVRRAQGHPSARTTTMLDSRFVPEDASLPLGNFGWTPSSGYNQQRGPNHLTNPQYRHLQHGQATNTQLGPLAAFNTDLEQRNASASRLGQPSSSSNMRLNPSMFRNDAFSNDVTLNSSPINGRFNAFGTPQELGGFPSMQSWLPTGRSSSLSRYPASVDDLSPGFGLSSSPPLRTGSLVFPGTQSTNSNQGSASSMNNSVRTAHNNFQASLAAAAAERPIASTPSRAMNASYPFQQPHQQLSLGLDTLDDPFGGTLGDAFGDEFPLTLPSGGIDDLFGLPTNSDGDMDFGNM